MVLTQVICYGPGSSLSLKPWSLRRYFCSFWYCGPYIYDKSPFSLGSMILLPLVLLWFSLLFSRVPLPLLFSEMLALPIVQVKDIHNIPLASHSWSWLQLWTITFCKRVPQLIMTYLPSPNSMCAGLRYFQRATWPMDCKLVLIWLYLKALPLITVGSWGNHTTSLSLGSDIRKTEIIKRTTKQSCCKDKIRWVWWNWGLFIHSFIHSFNKHLLNTSYVLLSAFQVVDDITKAPNLLTSASLLGNMLFSIFDLCPPSGLLDLSP